MTTIRLALALLVTSLTGCMAGSDAEAPLSYEEFKTRYIGTTTDPDGTVHLFYDWDQPLDSEEQVAALYDSNAVASEKPMIGFGSRRSASTSSRGKIRISP